MGQKIPCKKPLLWFCQPEKAVPNCEEWLINDGALAIFKNLLGEKLQYMWGFLKPSNKDGPKPSVPSPEIEANFQ